MPESSSSSPSSKKQIRPTVRKTPVKTVVATTTTPTSGALEDASPIEDVRLRMESWMGLKTNPSNVVVAAVESQPPSATTATTTTKTTEPTKSILKTPKYSTLSSSSSSAAAAVVGVVTAPSSSSLSSSSSAPQGDDRKAKDNENHSTKAPPPVAAASSAKSIFICKDVIVERDPTLPMLKRKPRNKKQPHATAVEGYVPNYTTAAASAALSATIVATSTPTPTTTTSTTTTTDTATASNQQRNDDDDDEEPLILSSVEELFQAAGVEQQPKDPTQITPDTQLLEADIAFSVFTQDQYGEKLTDLKREREQDREDQFKIFLGKDDVFGEENDNENDDDNNNAAAESEEDEDEFMEMLMASDPHRDDEDDYYHDNGGDDNVRWEDEPRAFRQLWDPLSAWITPEAVQWMVDLETPGDNDKRATFSNDSTSRQVDRSDVGASRCAGLMAMVKMYLPKCMNELHHPNNVLRSAERRLGDLLRTFDYSEEAPKLGVKLWKAMTCIFLDMVLIETREADPVTTIPPSVQAVGMTLDEYRYFTRSALQTFRFTME